MNDQPERTVQANEPPLGMDGRSVALLTAGHCIIDMCQGCVPALLPFFVVQHEIGYAAAAMLVLASSLASSVVQPLFGLFADRASSPWLLPASLLATGVGLVTAALAPGYGVAVAAIALSGLGVAGYHPEAARLVYMASGERRTTGMSYFSVGGAIGFATAPLLVAGLMAAAGPAGLLVLVVPPALLAVLIRMDRSRLATVTRPNGVEGRRGNVPPAQWPAFALLGCVIVIRSAAFVGLSAFLALYWVGRLGGSPAAGNAALATVLAAGVVGALAGGRLGDRWGRRAVIQGSLLISALLLGLLGATGDPLTSALLLVPIGLMMSAASGVVIVLGQEYLPGRIGVASGVTIGLAVSCGGAAAPLLGLAADRYGVGILPGLLAGLAAAAGGLALVLPHPGRHPIHTEVAVQTD